MEEEDEEDDEKEKRGCDYNDVSEKYNYYEVDFVMRMIVTLLALLQLLLLMFLLVMVMIMMRPALTKTPSSRVD